MKDKIQLLYGAIAGLVTPPIAFAIWIFSFTDYDLSQALDLVEKGSLYSEVLSLSAVSNMLVFYLFINKKNYSAARGVLLITIFLSFIVIATKLF
ncbi:MAG: hypothetical protein ABFR62_03320 [Bacteroidota bacterium]